MLFVCSLFQKPLNSAAMTNTSQSVRYNSSTAVPPIHPTRQPSHSGHVVSQGHVTSSNSTIGCQTPVTGNKRSHRPHFVASPEPSPPGEYVGQHSQGIGGHYAESYLAKRRRKLWPTSWLDIFGDKFVCERHKWPGHRCSFLWQNRLVFTEVWLIPCTERMTVLWCYHTRTFASFFGKLTICSQTRIKRNYCCI